MHILCFVIAIVAMAWVEERFGGRGGGGAGGHVRWAVLGNWFAGWRSRRLVQSLATT